MHEGGRKPRGDLEIVKRELREQEVKFLHKFKSRHTLAWERHNMQEETSVMAVLFGKNSSLLEMFDRHASQTKILRSVFLLLRYFLRGEKKPSGRERETLMIAEPRDPRPSLPRFYSSGRGCQLSSQSRGKATPSILDVSS